MSTDTLEAAAEPISARMIQEARHEAERTRRKAVEVLEERLGLSAEDFINRLGQTLLLPVLPMERLHKLTPAFDVLSYNEAISHECVAFRGPEGSMLVVFADPFNLDIQAWAEERIKQPFAWHLAHHTDLTAYLARHEETLRAWKPAPTASPSSTASTAC
jgi:general secretion pathway protein E